MSQAVQALGRVIIHRLAEIDRHILLTQDERELRRLWQVRRRLEKICRIFTGSSNKPSA